MLQGIKTQLKSVARRVPKVLVVYRCVRQFAQNAYHFIRRKMLRMSEADYGIKQRLQQLHMQIRILPDGRIAMPYIETYLAYGCNLRCEYCSHFSPFRKGIAPKETIIHSIGSWSKRFRPEVFGILGGEPLLHPDFVEIVHFAQQSFADSKICITTNGILLSKFSDEVFRSFQKVGRIEFWISQHLHTPEYLELLKKSKERFDSLGVPLSIFPSTGKWAALHNLDADGRAVPSQSKPVLAWYYCYAANYRSIIGETLMFCSVLANIRLSLEEGVLSDAWRRALSHKPMTLANSQEEILAYLLHGAFPECSLCPDKVEYIEAKQLTSEQIQKVLEQL
jgi:hypothetical protein